MHRGDTQPISRLSYKPKDLEDRKLKAQQEYEPQSGYRFYSFYLTKKPHHRCNSNRYHSQLPVLWTIHRRQHGSKRHRSDYDDASFWSLPMSMPDGASNSAHDAGDATEPPTAFFFACRHTILPNNIYEEWQITNLEHIVYYLLYPLHHTHELIKTWLAVFTIHLIDVWHQSSIQRSQCNFIF